MRISKPETYVTVFDVDGTLIENNIGLTFVKFLLKRSLVKPIPKVAILVVYVGYKIGILSFKFAIKAGAWALSGLETETVQRAAEECFKTEIKDHIFNDAKKEIYLCKKRGENIILATGAHSSIANEMAKYLGASGCVATTSKNARGFYDWQVDHPIPYMDGKRERVLEFIRSKYPEYILTVYTDEKKDIPLLKIADRMVGVNADKETKMFLSKNGGTTIDFR